MSHNKYDATIRLASDGLQLVPASSGLRFARGWALYRKGDIDSAIRDLNEAIRFQPTFSRAYVLRGSSYMLKGDYKKALADFDQAIRVDPRNAAAYCDRADLEHHFLRRPEKALADYNQAIRLTPNFQRAYFNRGVHFFVRHDYERAISDFNRAIQLMPNDPSGYAYLTCAYTKLGDRAQAVSNATMATRHRPATDFYASRALDLQMRSRAYRVLGQMAPALGDLREAIRIAPKDYSTHDNLAWFLATCPDERLRNGTEAVSAAKRACDLSHWQDSGCIDTLAAAYAEAGDFDQAVKYENHALSDLSVAPKEKQEREKHLALFQQRKPFRDEF
jgi:tetratricopeptide (TPR) repeat protein